MMQLIHYDAAKTALAEAVRFDDVLAIKDRAKHAEIYARQARDTELIERATEIKIRAERKAGQMLAEAKKTGDLRGKGNPQLSNTTTIGLDAIGVTRDESSRWQKLARIDEEKFEEAVTAAKEIAGEVTTAFMLRVEKAGTVALLHTGDEESYTPPEFIESARLVMNEITTDPASNDMAQETVKAGTYYTVNDDGLSKHWIGKVWMNPPYTALVINKFLEKLVDHYTAGDVTEAIVLTNNNTDTSWFHKTAKESSAFCFTAGRINFIKRDGTKSSPTNGQMFFYLGDNTEAFKREFSKHGLVMVKA